LLSAVRAAQPLAEQYKFIVIAPECADPSAWVSWQVADAASPPTLDQEHALVRHVAETRGAQSAVGCNRLVFEVMLKDVFLGLR